MIAYGKKYDDELTGAQIAAAIRADIKAAVAAGELPRAKYSVRLKTYSGGQSISIAFSNVPFGLFDREFLQHQIETDGRQHWDGERWSEAHRVLVHRLEEVGDAYNFDGSDIQQDYFNVNYYLHVGADSSYAAERRGAEMEILRAEIAGRNGYPARRNAGHAIDGAETLFWPPRGVTRLELSGATHGLRLGTDPAVPRWPAR